MASISVPTALAIGAGTSAAGGIASSLIGSNAAQNAAKTQANAAEQAAQLQMQMFNTIRGDLSPYRAAGYAALPAVYQLLGLQAPAGGTTPIQSDYNGFSPGGGGAPSGGYTLTDAQAQQLLTDRPDVQAAYNLAVNGGTGANGQTVPAADKNSPAYTRQGLDSPLNYARYWFNNMGGSGSYQIPGVNGAAAGGGSSASSGPLGTGAQGIEDFLSQTPGYQFTLDQGKQAITNQMAAQGLGGTSGAYAKGLAKYVTGLADTTYQQQLGNYMDLAGMGQNAAVQTGNAGTTAAGNAGASLTNVGSALAGGTVGAANAISGGIGSAFGGVSNALLMNSLLKGGMYGQQPGNLSANGAYTGATDLINAG